jgi:serine/threonine protein kinase
MSKTDQFKTLQLKAIGPGSEDNYHIHLVMFGDGEERRPIELGTGRNAVVFLGSSTADLRAVSQIYYAVKFLKDDPDQEYARVCEDRFFTEAENTHSFGQLAGSFVKYNSLGAIGLEPDAKVSDMCIKHLGAGNRDRINTGKDYTAILQSYYLQGPFYAIELCQATLYDLLDRNTPWLDLPVYRLQPPRAEELPSYREALQKTAHNLAGSIHRVINLYIDGDINDKSGYDILNAFKMSPEANWIRNYAVLEMFDRIVSVVRALHSHPRKLTHRDLKPGNVFLAHDADFDGVGSVSIKLGDLGFTAELTQLRSTNSLAHGIQNPAAQAPGSQFYRAPEQAELPVEVRVSFDEHIPNRVKVYSSKMSNVQVGDRLVIGDAFKKGAYRRSTDLSPRDTNTVQTVFKINEVLKEGRQIVGLVLDGALTIDKTQDIWAHVVRATGYHTDGYSLGAILYDLVSGGRNPEYFYIYCLARFIEEFSHVKYSVDDIVEALAPPERPRPTVHSLRPVPSNTNRWSRAPHSANGHRSSASVEQRLNRRERATLAWRILSNANVEYVIALLLNSSLDKKIAQSADNTATAVNDHLTIKDKWEILKIVMGADSVDDLIGLIWYSTLDVKMTVLRAAGDPPALHALNIGEKWDLLRLVMNADDAQGVLDLIFSSALEHAIMHEHGPAPDQIATTATSLRKKWDYLKIIMQSDDLEILFEEMAKSALKEDNQRRQEWLLNYRFRSFHIVSELLTDKRNVPIPRDIIRIIVKCMLRNINVGADASYYSSPIEVGFLGDENVRAVERIYRDTQACLTDVRNQLPPGFPDELQEDLLFKLRSMAPQPPIAASARAATSE